MSPGDAPYCAFVSVGGVLVRGWEKGDGEEGGRVPFECFCQPVRIAFYFEDLDCAV
jgi:hypothetical protein